MLRPSALASSIKRSFRLAQRRITTLGFATPHSLDQSFAGSRTLKGIRSESTRVVHVSYGTENFVQALTTLHRSAKRFGIDDIRLYLPDHPAVQGAVEENSHIMQQRRGAGYWLWKPYILLDTMDNVDPGTTIVYSDAGQRYIADPAPVIALAERQDVVLFHQDYLQGDWTKRDCFVLLDADEPRFWEAPQLDASIQLYRAGAKSRSFLLEMRDAMRDARILCDGPNVCGLPNLDGFRDHRHDQSVLTILAIKHGIKTHPSPKYVVNRALSGAANKVKRDQMVRDRLIVFEHHRRRNKPTSRF